MKSKNKSRREWPLFTIGYENYEIRDFADHLKAKGIVNLVDVRQYPKSRKPGFSKRELERFFAADGIRYIHIGDLGSPSELRKRVRTDKDYKYFFRQYLSYIEKQEESLAQLAEIIKQGTTCIFCLEADYSYCHRKSLAAYLNILYPETFEIIHL